MPHRSGAFTTFAVMNFIFGGLLLLCSGTGAIDMSVQINNRDVTQEIKVLMNQEVPGFTAYKIGGALIGFVLAVGLIVSGIGLLKGQNWGRVLAVICCIVAVLHHGGLIVLQIFFVNPAWDRILPRFGPFGFGILPKTIGLVGVFAQAVLLIYFALQAILLPLSSSEAPAGRPGRDDDDYRRRQPRRRDDDDIDDHDDKYDRPRRRPPRDDYEDDDRPRRSSRAHDEDDDEPRPRRRS